VETALEGVYTIESVARQTQMPRHRIAVYCRLGLIAPAAPPEEAGWRFDQETVRLLRRIEALRRERGINLAGLRVILKLLAEVERLEAELRRRG